MIEKVKVIVFLEDDYALLEIYREYFTKPGYSVYCARDVNKAIRLIKENDPDVFVTDYDLEISSSKEAIIYVRQNNPRSKIIMVSGNLKQAIPQIECLGITDDDYIQKPCMMAKLEEKILERIKTN
jgi:DNA-binding response OmpR family regulator